MDLDDAQIPTYKLNHYGFLFHSQKKMTAIMVVGCWQLELSNKS